ncbi:MAG: hypothetical protein J6D03_03605 [Clostridia bacterium]|nr:hypothetical protein [Clostridia bacterium]
MDRKVRDRIHEEMRKNGNLSKEYVVQLVKIYDEKPDNERLVEQYYKSKADRVISSFKDENGIRDCFAIKDSQNRTKYIDISKPTLLTKSEIESVRDKQIKLKKNKEEIILKVNLAHQVLEGQIQIQEYENALKSQLKVN